MSHTVEILSIGTELLLGNIVNADAQMLSQGLSELGLNVYYHTVVGDNPLRARDAVEIAKKRADIIITTGGLGPTYDDLTKQTICESFGLPMTFREDLWSSMDFEPQAIAKRNLTEQLVLWGVSGVIAEYP